MVLLGAAARELRDHLFMTAFGEGVLPGACIDVRLRKRNARDDFQLEVRDEAGILVTGRLHNPKHSCLAPPPGGQFGCEFKRQGFKSPRFVWSTRISVTRRGANKKLALIALNNV